MTQHDYGFAVSPETRIALPHPDQMTLAQRAIYDSVVSGPRGRLVGPLRAVIHSPELADKWQKFGAYLRYDSVFPEPLSELAILACGRRWNSDVEWAIHRRIALKVGVPESVVSAIEAAELVRFADESQREVYDFARLLLHHGQVSDPVYAAILKRWGAVGVVELTGLVGYYSMVAMMVNVNLIPIPDGEGPGITPTGPRLTELPESELWS